MDGPESDGAVFVGGDEFFTVLGEGQVFLAEAWLGVDEAKLSGVFRWNLIDPDGTLSVVGGEGFELVRPAFVLAFVSSGKKMATIWRELDAFVGPGGGGDRRYLPACGKLVDDDTFSIPGAGGEEAVVGRDPDGFH